MKVTITALAKYKDIFDYFRKKLDEKVSASVRKIVVIDGDEIKEAPGWEMIQGPDVFSMAGNHNIAWRAVEPDSDILTMNDDVYFLNPNPIEQFQSLIYSDPKIGALAPHCKIGAFGNPIQMSPRKNVPVTFVKTVTTGCLYLKREMIEQVGYLDESFNEKYGAEDADYTYRVNLAGWKVGIARDLPIKHGYGYRVSSSTSLRAIPDIAQQNRAGVERFIKKHGHFDVHGYWNWEEQQ